MDDDIAVADSAIAAGLGGLLRREKATADPFGMAAKVTTATATAKANRDGSRAVLERADQSDCGQVFEALRFDEGQVFEAVPGWSSEFVRVLEGNAAQVEGGAGGDVFEDCDCSPFAELLAAAFRFEDTFGDEQHACIGFEGLDGGFKGEMREEAERHGDVTEDAGPVTVAKDGGRAACVDVGHDAEGQVVATEEGGGEARSARSFVDGVVDLARQDAESIHHIDDIGGEELRDAKAKDVLCGRRDRVRRISSAGDVGEEEDDVRTGGDSVEEVAALARGVVAGVEIESLERRQSGGQRSSGMKRSSLHGWWRLYFVWHARPEYFCCGF